MTKKLRKEVNDKAVINAGICKKGFIEVMDDQEKAEMHKKVDKSNVEVSGLRKEVEKLKNFADDSKVIEERLKRVVEKKMQVITNDDPTLGC